MVVSHRETTISSNIRAIIEQLNLNPVERRRLIDRTRENSRIGSVVVDTNSKITIGVYGCNERNDRFNESTSNIKIGVYKEKNAANDCTDSPPKLRIYECNKTAKIAKIDTTDFTGNPTGKVTIGVHGGKRVFHQDVTVDNPPKTKTIESEINGIGNNDMRIQLRKIDDRRDEKLVEITRLKSKPEMRQRIPPGTKIREAIEVTGNSEDAADRESSKEDLPQLECASLNHTAAHHRISVRPKNRRPPRRGATATSSTTTSLTCSSISGSTTITTISESPDMSAESPEVTTRATNASSSPIETSKSSGATSALRKSSTRLSRNAEIFEELEAKIPPRKQASVASLSPDSLDSMTAFVRTSNGQEESEDSSTTRETGKPVLVMRKPSSRVSKGSEAMYEELEAKLPGRNKRSSSTNRLSKSPDSLESLSALTGSFSRSTEQMVTEKSTTENEDSRSSRKSINSKSSSEQVAFETSKSQQQQQQTLDEQETSGVEIRSRRLHNNRQISKSIEGFDKLTEDEETTRVTMRRYSNVVASNKRESNSMLRCADSLDAIENIAMTTASDDSIELRRSSFELAARKSTPKLMSMSSENFEALEHARDDLVIRPELKKRSSVSDVNLSRGGGRRYSRVMSKSTESFDAIETMMMSNRGVDTNPARCLVDLEKNSWRTSKRATLSSESSDNLELDDSLENRKARRPPKRVPSTSVVDIFPLDNNCLDNEIRRLVKPVRKPARLQKSSESSELGSTDTLDSERRNKSSDSTETLDSLEKDVEPDTRYEEFMNSSRKKRDKNDSWSAPTTEMETANGDEDSNRPLVLPDKPYWRQSSESKENIDIHQLLAITIVTRMSDNGNNQRNNAAPYPKKKQQQQQLTSPPSSPVVTQQQDQDNKLLFNNLLVNKNEEDLQNMLNGNISEVSTDTKSFKEKLIMFEKLGK